MRNQMEEVEQFLRTHLLTLMNPLQKLRKGSEIINDFGDLDIGTIPTEEVTYPGVSDVQVVGEASTG
ncbi:Hypothetical predicted protein [Olea europaea subsp. europaea]|uniref:Uncharacterized protein n=1 Tax=Olea europaea subsp. europaea TaxID=158383 RepID=A0A8S0QZD3_OLEEU|nr:Hypothetical predicted protein [Olea europaea subsp. europaea]